MRRVSIALAKPENKQQEWADQLYKVMENFHFLPAGRILAGSGSNRKITLFNCFVMGNISHDITGIFDSLKGAAVTMQHCGSIGYDFSTIRPQCAASVPTHQASSASCISGTQRAARS